MASTTETGHAKNVANFEDLISFCTGYGASYNPSKAAIALAALSTLRTNALAALANINALLPANTNAVNAREAAFSPLSKLITRVVNAADASDVSKQVKADVKTIARKLQGKRATPKNDAPAPNPIAPVEETTKNISASQMSFDQRIENLDKLIQLLAAQPAYIPNEPELSVAGLTTTLNTMRTTNTTAVNAYTPVSNARINRNTVLYAEGTGLVDIAGDVKSYVKSVFGATSPQYKQVSGLKFTKVKP
jgi:hypothetical protein